MKKNGLLAGVGIGAVIGLGIDMIEIERITEALERRSGARFEARVFTDGEIAYCRSKMNPYPHFAARFAAKEAAMKAFGTGWCARVYWKGIEVWNDERGKPLLKFNDKTEEYARELGVTGAFVSLSHDRGRAVAVALLLGGECRGAEG
ncbi:MAG: holo-ACP synthase [Gemmatimonadota bacterium]|nr:holo-ACP synthase [Gemmatimonadota bacterium]